MKDKRRDLRAYRRASERLKAKAQREGLRCWLCGEAIDFDADYRDPLSFTADHVHSLATGGPILGTLKPAHRRCNSRRGDGTRAPRTPTTRQW